MIEELHENLQTFVTRKFFVKITVGFLSLGKSAELLCRLFPDSSIDLAARYSERI
jgi:hypothetical protein